MEKAAEWQQAVDLVSEASLRHLQSDELLLGALLGACHQAEQLEKGLFIGLKRPRAQPFEGLEAPFKPFPL